MLTELDRSCHTIRPSSSCRSRASFAPGSQVRSRDRGSRGETCRGRRIVEAGYRDTRLDGEVITLEESTHGFAEGGGTSTASTANARRRDSFPGREQGQHQLQASDVPACTDGTYRWRFFPELEDSSHGQEF